MQDKMESSFNKVETKWNADNEKYSMVMEIETALETAFLSFDYEQIYNLIRAYRRQTYPKFKVKEQKQIDTDLDTLTKSLEAYKKLKTTEAGKNFYLEAEKLTLYISQLLKNAGIYYREGRDASHAILERS